MKDKLNEKLEGVRNQIKQVQENYETLTNQCNQLRNNLYALAGAEQVLSDLINELEENKSTEENTENQNE